MPTCATGQRAACMIGQQTSIPGFASKSNLMAQTYSEWVLTLLSFPSCVHTHDPVRLL